MKSIGQQISLREKMYYANSFQNFIIMNNGFITRTAQQRQQLLEDNHARAFLLMS